MKLTWNILLFFFFGTWNIPTKYLQSEWEGDINIQIWREKEILGSQGIKNWDDV